MDTENTNPTEKKIHGTTLFIGKTSLETIF